MPQYAYNLDPRKRIVVGDIVRNCPNNEGFEVVKVCALSVVKPDKKRFQFTNRHRLETLEVKRDGVWCRFIDLPMLDGAN